MKNFLLILIALFASLNLSKAQAPILSADTVTLPQGGTGEVTYTVIDYWNICNFNGTLTWDPTVITFDSITYLSVPWSMYPANFDYSLVSQGILSFTWSHPFTVGASIPDGDPVFKIRFIGTGASGSSSVLGFANNPVPLYWYNFAAWSGTITTLDGLALISGPPPIPPVAAFTVAGGGLTWAFTDASTGNPTSFLWDFGDGNTSTQQNPVHAYSLPGAYMVCLTASNAGGSDTACTVVNATINVGLDEQTVAPAFTIIATPGSIDILTRNSKDGELTADIYSPDGKKLASQIHAMAPQVRLDASNLKPGIYFIRLTAGGNVYNKKLYLP